MFSAAVRPEPFFNRLAELEALDRAWRHPAPGGQMALLYGRRRLGKTYLLQRFFAAGVAGDEPPKPHAYFLAEQTTAAAHRAALANQLLEALPESGAQPQELAVSWNALLRYVSTHCRQGERFGLILDEFPYLVEQSPELPSTLQSWWDREGAHARVFVVLCGSQLSTMAALGVESAPLFGRFNAGILLLPPLRYDEVAAFYANRPLYGLLETLTMYGVLGGTPRYHAMVDASRPMAEEIVALLLRPRSPLENEARFLLSSQQIRDPAPYNAVLGAIASGATQFGRILDQTGTERGALSFYLRTLIELGWIRRETPFGETSDRRAIYRVADPFLRFQYRSIAPLASALQFSDPMHIYRQRVEPYFADYMGQVFEEICQQWLQRHARTRLGLPVRRMGRFWTRDGQTELDIVAELEDGRYLLGECKWNVQRPLDMRVYADLFAKTMRLPEARWKQNPTHILFAVGGFAPEVIAFAADPQNRLLLVGGEDLL